MLTDCGVHPEYMQLARARAATIHGLALAGGEVCDRGCASPRAAGRAANMSAGSPDL